jgi:hypothetical protein
MRKIFILLTLTLIVSCFNNKKVFNTAVDFEKIEITKKGIESINDSTYDVSVAYCNPTNAPLYLKDSILKNTRLLFASWFDVKGQFDLNVSVKKHFDEYCKRVAENQLPNYTAFILDVLPEVVYQNEHIISFTYNWMIYEGGAHPNSGKFCFVLDKNTGSKVNFKTLIEKHETEFLDIAQTEFKAQSGIKADEEIYDLYWFKDKKFHLTDNYAFTSSGLVFYYNPYEIAPYSFGLITLILPYDKIEKLIKWQ